MGRGGRGKKNKKMWNRKNKTGEDANNGGGDGRDNQNEKRNEWNLVTKLQNPSFETYYAYQGLHSYRQVTTDSVDVDSKALFEQCTNDEEKEEERKRFMATMTTRLPASFRIGRHMDEDLTQRIIHEVKEFVGTEIELSVDSDGNLINKRETDRESGAAKSDSNEQGEAEKESENGAADDKDKGGESTGMDIDKKDESTTVSPADATSTTIKDDKDMDTDKKDESNAATDTVDNDTTTTPTIETFIKKLAPATSIPYVPNAYQLSVDRRTIKRNPSLTKFHEWLKVQQEAGFITRQETVSMIPPVVLDPEPHHAVLDMCAAPGSKTSQLLEIIAAIPKGESEPTGYVVANDSDAKRAYMLVHQLRRLNSPAAIMTACDGQSFPMIKGSKDYVMTDQEKAQEGVFDRVLCDVPCTGDGTARKNPGIWKRWLATNGCALHPLQLNISLNGARLTKVGGYLCYSTCSLNPIENEAVVAELLRACDGSLELVDKRPDMTGFVARPGWTTWKVVTEAETRKEKRNRYKKNNEKMRKKREAFEQSQKEKEGEEVKEGEKVDEENKQEEEEEEPAKPVWESSPPSWDENTLFKRLEARGLKVFDKVEDVGDYKHVKRSMFPPTEEEIKKFNLEKCMRCLPHDMNTGGFFIALFKKVKPLGERNRRKAEELDEQAKSQESKSTDSPEVLKKTKLNNGETKDMTSNETEIPTEENEKSENIEVKTDNNNNKKRERDYQKVGKEDFVEVDKDIMNDMVELYGLSDAFAHNQLMARGTGNSKLLYFISSSIKKNFFDRGVQNRVKVIHSGLRAFERRSRGENDKSYRPCQESIHFIIRHMSKRKFIIDNEDFSKCIGEGAISTDIFSTELKEEMNKLSSGAFAVALKGYETDYAKKLFLVMWKCRGENVNCLVARAELDGFRSKLNAIS